MKLLAKADGEEMIEQLVEKLKSATTNSERLLVVTAVPKSWSARKTASVFGVSRRFAGRAKKLVEEVCCPVQTLRRLKL